MARAPRCPKCGAEVMMGYGLAGGGLGPYVYCSNVKCDHFEKFQDPPEPPKEAP